ncbi:MULTISPECIES: hypothetical protein [unclassified Megasphaera]|uniref:hypothetical protein n=1 Tax=unclassified Megasphaera TaxID=2626256 RepID=UPI000ED702B1|nr:hypothetical protein [Megasphaera sp. UBA4233]HAM03915.1 hypothetical protein [Megasphaera sp.]
MRVITADEAVSQITEAVAVTSATAAPAERLARKFVYDVLDYCNRGDFPEALVYVAEEMVTRWLEDKETGGRTPVKSIEQNDTKYEFAVSDTTATGSPIEDDFNSIKPKLNLYRRPMSL